MTAIAAILDQQIKAVCPIAGVAIADAADKSSWRIDFSPDATPAQKSAARALLSSFDVTSAETAAERARALAASEPSLARIVEDLIDVLVVKKAIALTDLPQSARDKLAERKALKAGG